MADLISSWWMTKNLDLEDVDNYINSDIRRKAREGWHFINMTSTPLGDDAIVHLQFYKADEDDQ
jgi:hypothetical protein